MLPGRKDLEYAAGTTELRHEGAVWEPRPDDDSIFLDPDAG